MPDQENTQRPSPLKLLLVSPSPPPAGGIATWTRVLLEALESRTEVRVKHVDVAIRWKSTVDRSLLLRVVGGSLQGLRDCFRVGMQLLCFRPDVLHVTSSARLSSPRDALMMVLARLSGATGIIHYHVSFARYESNGGWQLRLAILAMRLARAVVVLDQRTLEFLTRRLGSRSVWALPNMISIEELRAATSSVDDEPRNDPRSSVRLAFLGWVVPTKGVMEQVRACVGLEGVELHMIGEFAPRCREQLEEVARERLEGRWLCFHGRLTRSQALQRLRHSDILLLPSYDEGFPYCVLEAMALEKPVVVSDVGALPEMIDADGEDPCGVCVPPRNADALQLALINLINRREDWNRMGRAGKKRVRDVYSTEPVLERLIEEWRAAIHSRQPVSETDRQGVRKAGS